MHVLKAVGTMHRIVSFPLAKNSYLVCIAVLDIEELRPRTRNIAARTNVDDTPTQLFLVERVA